MPLSSETKLSLGQLGAGIAFLAFTTAIIPIHDASAELVCAVLGISSAVVGLGLEFFKSVNRSDERHQVVTEERAKFYNDLAEGESRLMRRIAVVEDNLTRAIGVLTEHESSTPLHKCWRALVLAEAKERLRQGYLTMNDQATRIKNLSEFIRVASMWVYAYTYATPEYMVSFWDDDSTEGYLRVQSQRRDELPRFQVKRVFVVPETILHHQYALLLLRKTLATLEKLHLEVYLITYNEAARRMREVPERSFLVVDEEVVSEAEPDIIGSAGKIGYHESDAREKIKIFHDLMKVCGPPLEADELRDPWTRLDKFPKHLTQKTD